MSSPPNFQANSANTQFLHKYHKALQEKNTMLCVGLDPDMAKIPSHLQGYSDAIFTFCKEIVDATADLVCAFKPQIAYFAAQGAETQLEQLMQYIQKHHPEVPIILDAKRGDIGATATQYAIEAFERYGADAVTVNPYMGFDSIEPYLKYADRGVFVLCRTSNPGGSDLQFLELGKENAPQKLYEKVASLAATQWNSNGQLGLVVGATFPEEIARVRAIVGDMPLLIPGIGAQGGDVVATVQAGQKNNLLINSSRAILYASDLPDFAQAARNVAIETRDSIRAV
jgi:orotidine-5'-phosphate decarboxylase